MDSMGRRYQITSGAKRKYPLAKIGERFGSLVVIGHDVGKQKGMTPIVECDCGRMKFSTRNDLLQIGRATRCCICQLDTTVFFGDRHVRQLWYLKWHSMCQRCHNKNHFAYKDYGLRGIRVCPRWRSSFLNYAKDIISLPGYDIAVMLGLHLGRIDNDRGYFLDNVEFQTPTVNNRNRRNSRLPSFAELLDFPDLERVT